MSLNDKKTLLMRKFIKQKEIQVADMETLAKIILVVVTYAFLEGKKILIK